MRVKVDVETCISCGVCPEVCPEMFEMGDDGKAHEKQQDVPSELEEKVREASAACPVEAIPLEE